MESIARLPNHFGAAIRRRRQSLGLTQKQLGDLICTRQATISNLERGEPGTQLATILKVLSALEMEMVIRPITTLNWDNPTDGKVYSESVLQTPD